MPDTFRCAKCNTMKWPQHLTKENGQNVCKDKEMCRATLRRSM